MNREHLLTLARQVSPFHAQKYLLAKGWKLASKNPRQDIILFNRPRDKFNQIIIPKSNDYELYGRDLLRAISRLEEEEHRDAESILGQMFTLDADILRYRIRSPQAESGTLSLASVQTLISGVVASLSAALCDVLSPDNSIPLLHRVTKTKQVRSLLEKAQFGQTEHGSFVVKVVAPLDNLSEGTPSFVEMLDGGMRQGVVHLLKSVTSIVDTVKKGTTRQFIKKGLDKPLFSVNLVNSIMDMQLWSDADIEISSEWSPSLLPDKHTPSSVFVPSAYFDDIGKMCRAFTPKDSDSPVEFFSGFVTELCGENDESDQKYGDVVIQLTCSDGESFPATVFLPANWHQDAISGYKRNIPVYLSGKLVREGRKRKVRELGFFKLCEEEDIRKRQETG